MTCEENDQGNKSQMRRYEREGGVGKRKREIRQRDK